MRFQKHKFIFVMKFKYVCFKMILSKTLQWKTNNHLNISQSEPQTPASESPRILVRDVNSVP